VIVLDTSVLVEALAGPKRCAPALRSAIESGERILVPTLALYEWLRGPRTRAELGAQEALFPREAAIPFGPDEAALAASLYGRVGRARGREIDLAIAACALLRDAALWTLNGEDFEDVPDLRVIVPKRP
jgi:predicted nucleic acid-binding protein